MSNFLWSFMLHHGSPDDDEHDQLGMMEKAPPIITEHCSGGDDGSEITNDDASCWECTICALVISWIALCIIRWLIESTFRMLFVRPGTLDVLQAILDDEDYNYYEDADGQISSKKYDERSSITNVAMMVCSLSSSRAAAQQHDDACDDVDTASTTTTGEEVQRDESRGQRDKGMDDAACNRGIDDDICPVCLDAVVLSSSRRSLPPPLSTTTTTTATTDASKDVAMQFNNCCASVFHKGCLEAWLSARSSCPCCRTPGRLMTTQEYEDHNNEKKTEKNVSGNENSNQHNNR